MSKIENAINKQLGWFQTMERNGAYYGPVFHYWSHSLPYIGWGIDWRYEGLVEGFIQLHKLSGEKYFLHKLKEMSDFILFYQRTRGGFQNCGFEANPSFNNGNMPHEACVSKALVSVSNYFNSLSKSSNLRQSSKKYLECAKNFADNYLIPNFWNKKENAFMQYESSRNQKVNIFVPNKMASISEFLFCLSKQTKDKKYLSYGKKNLQKSLSLQREDGATQQSEKNDTIITYYNAREIPAFLLYGYKENAERKAQYIKKQWNSEWFSFGEKDSKKIKYPYFLAGGGDILSSLSFFYPIKKYLKPLLSKQLESGGFKSFYGLKAKNTFSQKTKEIFEDIVPAVGWNDKTFSFLSKQLDSFSFAPSFSACSLKNPYYRENGETIQGRNFFFKKKTLLPSFIAPFTERQDFYAKTFYSIYKRFSNGY